MFSPNEEEIERVRSLNSNKRYEYFIKKVVDWDEVWGLFNNGWAMQSDGDGNSYFPIWPAKIYAAVNKNSEWEKYEPKSFDIDDLINGLIPKLKKENVKLSIFPVKNEIEITTSLDQFVKDINSEEDKY